MRQYLSLPISNATTFTLADNVNDIREQLDLVYRIYDYKTSGRYFNALSFTYKYDYRTVSIDAHDSSNSITNLYEKDNNYFSCFNSIYDFFFTKQYIIPFVCFIVLDLITILLTIWAFIKVVKYSPFSISSLVLVVSCVLSVLIGLLLNLTPFLNLLFKVPLSSKSWQAFIAMAVQQLLILLVSMVVWVAKEKSKSKKIIEK